MLKILHLNNYISYTSGVTRYIYSLVKHTKHKFDHKIMCLEGDAFEIFQKEKVKILRLKYNGLFSFPGIYFFLRNYCMKNHIDIIHNHHRIFDTLTSMFSAEKFKTVTTVHSKVYGRKSFSYKADKLISVSDSITNHLIHYYHKPAEKIRRMKNFVDISDKIIDTPAEELKKALNLSDKKVILFVGRFSLEKGVDILIKAFKDIFRINNNVALLMVGDGEEESSLKNFCAQNKLPVHFQKPLRKVFNCYNIADIIVLPSRVDPFPYVMLEAGLMKKPFIGSDVDGIPELIEQGVNGLLFEKENIGGLVNSIEMILKDESLGENLADKLYSEVTNNYTAEKIIPDYIEFYNSLL